MPQWFAGFILTAITIQSGQVVPSGTTDELARCVVFLRQNVPAGSLAKVGSGFLVAKNDEVYLVTAAHVARDVGSDWTLLIQGSDGKAATAPIKQPAWQFSQQHHVAVLRLNPKDEQKAFLLARSLSVKVLIARPLPPTRDVTLTVMGYPHGIGTDGFVSPLSIETKAASGFVTFERFDTKQPATFILLQAGSHGTFRVPWAFDLISGASQFQPRRDSRRRPSRTSIFRRVW